MQFGVKQGEAPVYDPESGTGGGSYIKYFKDNETRLRFLEPVHEWTEIWMHFSQNKSRDYPCTGQRSTCPGCNHENEREAKAQKRYIVNAYSPKSEYVDLWKIPASLIDDFIRFETNDGSISARDYTVLKYIKEGRTKYSVDKEDKDAADLSEHQQHMRDHQEALQEAFREVWGGLPDEPEYTGGDLYEAPINKSGYLQPPKPQGVRGQHVTLKQEDDLPPTEPAAQSDQGEQEIELSEAQLRAMSADELIALYKRIGMPTPAFSGADDLVDHLIAALA
jgi:hypothetical protein